MFSHTSERVVEWGDCDPAGIVFYPRYFAMFDAATAAMLEAATGLPRIRLVEHHAIMGWPMVDTRSVFRAVARFDDRVRIETRVVRLGRASFDIAHDLWRGDLLCVEATEVRVWAARSGAAGDLSPSPLPDDLRRVLSCGADDARRTVHV